MSNSMLIMLAGLLAEILLVALVVMTIAYLRDRAQRKRDLTAVKTLIARIKNGKAEREKTIAQFLEQGMGLSDEALQQAKVATLRAEFGLLQRIAGVYRLREAEVMARMDDELYAAIAPYHALTSVHAETASRDAAPVDESELEELRAENHRLSEELTITMETMSRMLNEYSNMFAGGAPRDAAPITATAASVAAAAAAAADQALGDDEVMIASAGEDQESAAQTDDAPPAVADDVEIADPTAGALEESSDVDIVADDVEIASGGPDEPSVDDVIVAAEPAAGGTDMDALVDAAADEESVIQPGDADSQLPAEPDASTAAASDEDDEIAAILREAQSQEMSARSSDGLADDGVVDDEATSADLLVGEEPPPEVGQGAAAEDTAQDVVDDLDDLFDAAGDDLADVIVDGGEAGVDAPTGDQPPLTSQGGS